MPKRNLFLTKTAIGSYIGFLATAIAVSPNIESLLTRNKSDEQKVDVRDYISIAVGFAGLGSTLLGRYSAGGVYTPDGTPGEDKVSRLQ